jgi:glycosyltransferase involved in cell wall biosynthesis
LRIAFYAPRASFLEPGFSGDRIFLRNLLRALRERGHEVEVASRLNVRRLRGGRIPARRLFTEALSVRRWVQRFSPDAWLVYNPSVMYPDLFGWWQHPRSYVLFAASTWKAQRLRGPWRWLFAFAHRQSLRRADKITVFRPRTAERLRSSRVAQQRLCVLPPAGRTWDAVPSREEARERLGLPRQAPVILCVSRFTKPTKERKTDAILSLLQAFAALPPEVVLVLVGDGPGRPGLEEEAARVKPEGRIRLVGSTEDLRCFYAACDFFAFPDLDDRPRLAILEAQACGRPVVTMRTGSAEITVEAGLTGLLARDLGEFQAHLALLAGDTARCESMGQAAREYIARRHSMQVRVDQIEDLLLARS